MDVGLDTHLSANLTLGEVLRTDHHEFDAAQQDPAPIVLFNLRRHAVDLWQPVHDLVGPMRVDSGFRCPGLNVAVGGASNSAHMYGLATDNVPLQMSTVDAYRRIQKSGLPWDKLIFEHKGEGRTWIHMQSPSHGKAPRRQALMFFPDDGYTQFKPNDPRVRALA